ncbi:hypothetical protein HU200_042689 [Digitaria exilis]|uniref:Uncharacterized protein n=1 Tax=Digitaria exilis TaxID=1010633 RepID=A0A835BCX8_9POAL|nr:hypothetical protein HU200_042689 [Digitaria exilis]
MRRYSRLVRCARPYTASPSRTKRHLLQERPGGAATPPALERPVEHRPVELLLLLPGDERRHVVVVETVAVEERRAAPAAPPPTPAPCATDGRKGQGRWPATALRSIMSSSSPAGSSGAAQHQRNDARRIGAFRIGHVGIQLLPWTRQVGALLPSLSRFKYHARHAQTVASFIDEKHCDCEKPEEEEYLRLWLWTDVPHKIAMTGTLQLEEYRRL